MQAESRNVYTKTEIVLNKSDLICVIELYSAIKSTLQSLQCDILKSYGIIYKIKKNCWRINKFIIISIVTSN